MGLPYGFLKVRDPFDAPEKIGFKKSYALIVYFPNRKDRKKFAAGLKVEMKRRGKYTTGHLRP